MAAVITDLGQSEKKLNCAVCKKLTSFKSNAEFRRHLKDFHCTQEGGSFVCRYGSNNICPSLPLEGVSDKDYEAHVSKDHLYLSKAKRKSPSPRVSTNNDPAIVKDQHRWTIFDCQVNLPALLNDPHRGRQADFFTRTWGEAFDVYPVPPCSYLPDVNQKSFYKYLRKVNQRVQEQSRASERVTPVLLSDDLPLFSAEFLARKQDKRLQADLEKIPQIFFEQQFSLEERATFDAVLPWHQISSQRRERKHSDHENKLHDRYSRDRLSSGSDTSGRTSGEPMTRRSSKLLQEKLHHHVDIVEEQIAHQISTRSEHFFKAVAKQDSLRRELERALSCSAGLRKLVIDMRQRLTQGPLKALYLARQRSNLTKLSQKLHLMSTVHQTQPTVQLLLANGEYLGALDLINTSQEVLQQELPGLHCFRHLHAELQEKQKDIERLVQQTFVQTVDEQLARPVQRSQDEGSGSDVLSEEGRLLALTVALLRLRQFTFAATVSEAAREALKSFLKQVVLKWISREDVETQDPNATLAEQMRRLNFPQWLSMLDDAFDTLSVVLQRIKAIHTVLLAAVRLAAGRARRHQSLDLSDTQTASDTPTAVDSQASIDEEETASRLSATVEDEALDLVLSSSEQLRLETDVHQLMTTSADNAHTRCIKLLDARAKDGFMERLSSADYVRLSKVVEKFVSQCEAITGRKTTKLRAKLQSQCNKFVSCYHDERRTKLSLILDNERWKPADVPYDFQMMVDRIASSGELRTLDEKIEGHAPADHLLVNGEKFIVVGTVLLVLKMLVEYCQCVSDIPATAPDLLLRLEEMLNMFNSRTCQLILGAGAVRIVGLRTITTKHLGLSVRCLQLVLHFLPRVRSLFARLLSSESQHMVKRIDKLQRDYTDHVTELYNKLTDLMDEMFRAQLSQWEAKPPAPSQCFRSMRHQMSRFHEALSPLLPSPQLQELFSRIHGSFKLQLKRRLGQLGVGVGSPRHGVVVSELAFFKEGLRPLSDLDAFVSSSMDDIWIK